METAQSLIKDALSEIGVIGASETMSDDDKAMGMRHLNRMMAREEGSGVFLGYTPVSVVSDPITIPLWSHDWAILGLAISLSKPYESDVSVDLATSFRNANSLVRAKTVKIGEPTRPSDMPRGAADSYGYGYYENSFYNGKSYGRARLTGNSTVTTLSGAAAVIAGTWIDESVGDLSADNTGVLSSQIEGVYKVSVDVTFTGTGEVTFYLAKKPYNGVMEVQGDTARAVQSATGNTSRQFTFREELYQGDAIQLWVKSANNVTVKFAVVTAERLNATN